MARSRPPGGARPSLYPPPTWSIAAKIVQRDSSSSPRRAITTLVCVVHHLRAAGADGHQEARAVPLAHVLGKLEHREPVRLPYIIRGKRGDETLPSEEGRRLDPVAAAEVLDLLVPLLRLRAHRLHDPRVRRHRERVERGALQLARRLHQESGALEHEWHRVRHLLRGHLVELGLAPAPALGRGGGPPMKPPPRRPPCRRRPRRRSSSSQSAWRGARPRRRRGRGCACPASDEDESSPNQRSGAGKGGAL